MSLAEISNIVFDQYNAELILDRILDFSVLSDGEVVFSLDEDEEKSFYDRIIMNQKLGKPTLDRINEEVEEYKSELAIAEQARIDEENRVKNINDRFASIDFRGAVHKLGLDIPNSAIELKRILKEDDQAFLASLESANLEFQNEMTASKNLNDKKSAGKKARMACENALDLVAGYNLERSLTAEQINSMESMLAAPVAYLRANRPSSAKEEIMNISPDEVLVTQEMKDAVLNELGEY